MKNETFSKHNGISFTAHYTGYQWYLMGISHPAFATKKGKYFNRILHPIEKWSEQNLGGSLRKALRQRHSLIDHNLEKLLEKHPDLQVAEIATGLSPRGWHFRQCFPNLQYVEVDLPAMATLKKHALAQAGQADAIVLAIDLFSPGLADLFHHFDPKKPLLIISEGLINYFDLGMLSQLWSELARHGQQFTDFYYLTDLLPQPKQQTLSDKIFKYSGTALKYLSRSAFSFHFHTPSQTTDFFKDCGFQDVYIQQPSQINNLYPNPDDIFTHSEKLNASQRQAHLGDMVWVILAK